MVATNRTSVPLTMVLFYWLTDGQVGIKITIYHLPLHPLHWVQCTNSSSGLYGTRHALTVSLQLFLLKPQVFHLSWIKKQPGIQHDHLCATLMIPIEGETVVCGSSISLVEWLGKWWLVAANKTLHFPGHGSVLLTSSGCCKNPGFTTIIVTNVLHWLQVPHLAL